MNGVTSLAYVVLKVRYLDRSTYVGKLGLRETTRLDKPDGGPGARLAGLDRGPGRQPDRAHVDHARRHADQDHRPPERRGDPVKG